MSGASSPGSCRGRSPTWYERADRPAGRAIRAGRGRGGRCAPTDAHDRAPRPDGPAVPHRGANRFVRPGDDRGVYSTRVELDIEGNHQRVRGDANGRVACATTTTCSAIRSTSRAWTRGSGGRSRTLAASRSGPGTPRLRRAASSTTNCAVRRRVRHPERRRTLGESDRVRRGAGGGDEPPHPRVPVLRLGRRGDETSSTSRATRSRRSARSCRITGCRSTGRPTRTWTARRTRRP